VEVEVTHRRPVDVRALSRYAGLPNRFLVPLKASEEEKAVVGIQVGSIPMVRQITVHENQFGVSKDNIVSIQPSRFFCQVKHCDKLLLENPEQLKSIS
jgi:hypothetical protein